MIRSWKNTTSRRFATDGRASKFRGLEVERAHERLAALNAATCLGDLGALRSLGLHKLGGDRAFDVEIVDYH